MNQFEFKLFQNLCGEWNFTRIIANEYTPAASGKVNGNANFIQVEAHRNLLHYTENGKYSTVSEHNINTTNEYYYLLSNTGAIEIYFATNRTMQQLFLKLNNDKTAEHICLLDRYQAWFKFSRHSFSIIYAVKGPKKAYTVNTTYNKVLSTL